MIIDEKLKLPTTGENYYLEYFKNAGNANSIFFTFSMATLQLKERNTCREIFSNAFTVRQVYIGFTSGNLNIQRLNEFFQIIEDKLELPENQRTQFLTCIQKHIVICKVSAFWRKNILRRQFFTLFLRAGGIFHNGDWKETWKNYKLGKGMTRVINFFLDGNTIQTPNSNKTIQGGYGIVYHYKGLSTKVLAEHLQK